MFIITWFHISSVCASEVQTKTDLSIADPHSKLNTDKHSLQRDENCTVPPANIIYIPNEIFDETEEGIYFFHRWANFLHITTKPITLENEAGTFESLCIKTKDDLAELERHYRSKKYLREAFVTSDDSIENITVTTWDKWSLLPTVSFGRKGGINTYSFGIKDRNLLGLGIDAEFESYSNTQRTGYKLVTTIPLFQKMNTDLTLKFADNDDGKQQLVSLNKHFASVYTDYAYNLAFNDESRVDTLFQNDKDQSIFAHDISYINASYSWLIENTADYTFRLSSGITQDKHTFNTAEAFVSNLDDLPVQSLPNDRDFLTPWLGFQYIEHDYKELVNVRSITEIEDFNHGWQMSGSFGVGNGNADNSAWVLWHTNIAKGFVLSDDDLLLMNVYLSGDIYDQGKNRLLASVQTEYFHKLSPQFGFYFDNVNVFSKNQYQDRPITLGGNAGLRGFPLQYQHGESTVKFSTELRYYPRINILKLFDLAGAVFVDAGKAFGEVINENVEPGWLTSAGIGLRAYSPHTGSDQNILHVDLAFPQSDNPDINSVEIRIQGKKSF